MMNDRFSAGLRQHLLDTADERPAEGQLEAVVERLAVTAQRPPLVARLAGFPGRIGPFPSTAVRWALIAAALLAATMAAAMLGGGGGPVRSTVFEGTWTTIDPADDSRMTLVVAAGMTPVVHFEDALATGGACVADEVKVFTADGTGQVSGSLLAVSFPDGGGCGLMTVEIGPGFYDYDEATDVMTDSSGLAWFRVPEDGSLPTSQASATPDPCPELPVGGTYQAPAGPLGLTVSLPNASEASWSGLEDAFRLEMVPCPFAGPVRIEAAPVTRVYTNLCDPADAGVAVISPAAAMAVLAPIDGIVEVGPTEVTLGGYAGLRLEFSIAVVAGEARCPDWVGRAFDGVSSVDPRGSATVQLLDVDGTLLAVVTYWNESPDPDTVAEVDAVVASLRIEP